MPYPHHADLSKSKLNPHHPSNYYKSIFSSLNINPITNTNTNTNLPEFDLYHPYNPSFQEVYHIVRNPMKHIASFTSHLLGTYRFILHAMHRLDYSGLPSCSVEHLVCWYAVSLVWCVYR